MSQLDSALLQFFLLSFCPLLSMFQLTLWWSRNSSVLGRVLHHSLQTGMGRRKRSHPDGCIHSEFFQPPWPQSTGMTLVMVRPWSSPPRDPLPGPGMPWAHSPLVSPSSFTPRFTFDPNAPETNRDRFASITFTLMLWKERSASQQKYFCKGKACPEPSQGTALPAVTPRKQINKIIILKTSTKQSTAAEVSFGGGISWLLSPSCTPQGGSAFGLYTGTASRERGWGGFFCLSHLWNV